MKPGVYHHYATSAVLHQSWRRYLRYTRAPDPATGRRCVLLLPMRPGDRMLFLAPTGARLYVVRIALSRDNGRCVAYWVRDESRSAAQSHLFLDLTASETRALVRALVEKGKERS